jgi:protein SCO1/2
MMKKRLLRLLIILVLALGFSALLAAGQIALLDRGMKRSKPTEPAPQGLAGVRLGGPFALTDHTGRSVDETLLQGRYNLIYFGFTFCPAICPTELQKIRLVLDRLGTRGDMIQPVFITVDPERDTVEIMKNYVALFHPRLIGLTGTPEAIADTLKHWRVYARKVDDPSLSDYTVDHSSYIYWIAPDGTVLGMFGIDQTVDDITAAIERSLPVPE